ncbi:hypothetical protein [Flavobacterium sp. JP2137]|uniref:hypothetical protein n=1 Tax=Flavobacterium sp. JP2137 TaxID=3414510 RepID=UPI003D300E8A
MSKSTPVYAPDKRQVCQTVSAIDSYFRSSTVHWRYSGFPLDPFAVTAKLG